MDPLPSCPKSPSYRWRRITSAAVGFGLVLAVGQGVAQAATVTKVPVKYDVDTLVADPDGTIRASTSTGYPRGELAQLKVGPQALVGQPLSLFQSSRTNVAGNAMETSDGAVVVYRTLSQPHPRVRVVQWRAGKMLGKAQTISDARRAARPGGITTSPSGAVAVGFSQHVGEGRWSERIAIRPAGATRFLSAIAVDPDRTSRGFYSGSRVVFGPNGEGAVVLGGGRGSSVRRIARDGSVGPAIAIPLGAHDGYDGLDAAVGAEGGIALAWSTRDIPAGEPRTEDDRQIATREAWVAELPAGAAAVSTPRRLASVTDGNDASYEASVSVGPTGQLLIAVNGNGVIQIWEGPGAASVASAASFPNVAMPYFVDGLFLFATADGGAAALWADRMMLRGPDGAWSAPERVLPGSVPNTNVESAVPMPSGGIAAVMSEWPDADNRRHYSLARLSR